MKYFEDFQIGEKFVSRGRTITEADIVLFAAFSGDWHPFHTNIEVAKKGPFKKRIAHGLLVLSVASGLMPVQSWDIIAFYGMDKIKFVMPTMIGDTIQIEMEVVERKEKDDGSGVVSFKNSIKNQRGEDVAVLIMRLLLRRSR